MTRAEALEAALRTVAAMQCAGPYWRHERVDCREDWSEAMGGTLPEAEQRKRWCPRCVAADALERLPET